MAQQSHENPRYSDSSPFVRLLSTPGRVKILDLLLRRHSSQLTAEEIAEQAGIDEATFSRNKDVFLELDIVETSLERGRTTYRLNTDSEVVTHFGRAHTELLRYAETLHDELGRDDLDATEAIQKFLRERSESNTEASHISDDARERLMRIEV